MPGHMNVLLAEADVPYDQLKEMDDINPEFARTDVSLVIGANDVTNPAANSNPDSPIYGMPILNVNESESVIVIKRSMNPGFAGIENELYYDRRHSDAVRRREDGRRRHHRGGQGAVAGPAVTFAVVGHDEARTLPIALGQAFEAAETQDAVWFVDSASTDGSAEVAAGLGAEVVTAPLGKGRAMAHAIERCRHALRLLRGWGPGGVRAQHPGPAAGRPGRPSARHARGGVRLGGPALPQQHLRRLHTARRRPVPRGVRHGGRVPFSGFRVLRTDLELDGLPPGFGIETHLNLTAALRGWSVRHAELGSYEGVERPKPGIGHEIAGVILDLAERHGRLEPACRGAWEDWVEQVVQVTRECPPHGVESDEYEQRLADVAARPLPASAHAA